MPLPIHGVPYLAATAMALFVASAAIAQEPADSAATIFEGVTPDGATYLIPTEWVIGETLHISGSGWTNQDERFGSTIAVKYDFGDVWAVITAEQDGSWETDLEFPTSAEWSVGEIHSVHLLTGALGENDKIRNPLIEVTIIAASPDK